MPQAREEAAGPRLGRPSSLLSVEKKLVKRVPGTLHPEDLACVTDGLREAFRPLVLPMERDRGTFPLWEKGQLPAPFPT